MVIETDADEANYGNNEKDVSVHAKCVISLSSGNGGTVRGTGSYSYGSTVTISAIPNEGYMFEGWYPGSYRSISLPLLAHSFSPAAPAPG